MIKKMEETLNSSNKDQRIYYQINRAKEYLEKNWINGEQEPTLECCIIHDLFKIVEKEDED